MTISLSRIVSEQEEVQKWREYSFPFPQHPLPLIPTQSREPCLGSMIGSAALRLPSPSLSCPTYSIYPLCDAGV